MQSHYPSIVVPLGCGNRPSPAASGSPGLRISLLACLLAWLTLAGGSPLGAGRTVATAEFDGSTALQPRAAVTGAATAASRATTAVRPGSASPDEAASVAAVVDARTLRLIFTPSIMPTRGRLSSRFGYRQDPVLGGRRFHRGLDISAPPGEPVLATADGVVSRAGFRGGLGRSVSVTHGYGLVTTYSHLASLGVAEGEEVRRGEMIGRVGISGRATGYHLHYEVFKHGRPVDPLAYISSRPRT